MRNTNSSLRLVYLCALLLFRCQSFQAEVKRKVTQNTDIEAFENGRKSVGARHLFSTNIATEQEHSPLSEVQTIEQENTKNASSLSTNTTTKWSALKDTEMPIQKNSTILKKEAKDSLIGPEISSTGGSGALDPVETPIAYLNRGRSSHTRSSSGPKAGSDTDEDDGDDSGLSRTAIIAIVASIVGVFLLALIICLIQYCNQPYFRQQRRNRKAAQRSSELKTVAVQNSSDLKAAAAQDDASHQMETSL